MTPELRDHVAALRTAGDLVGIEDRLSSAAEPFAVAAEAARANGPALVFEDAPGVGRPVAGATGGPDGTLRRDRLPRARIARGLGLAPDVGYTVLLERIAGLAGAAAEPETGTAAAEPRETDVAALSLPRPGTAGEATITAGALAVRAGGETRWAPVRGTVRGRRELRVHVPESVARAATGASVRVALGIPPAAAAAASVGAVAGGIAWSASPPAVAAGLAGTAVTETEPAVPASSEVIVDATATAADDPPAGPRARWEAATPTASLSLTVTGVAARPDPLLPVVPLGEPLADDRHLTGLVEAARLYARVNGYWGVSPVEWVALPVEAGLGLCLVASELLYAGFEWQLANTLFSYGDLFDKVVVLDAGVSPDDLGRALDDIWVKAHPSRDWVFGEASAPAPSAPAYRADGETGSRLYVNAAWDPAWDAEYIAPEVGFEATYDADFRAAVRDRWEGFGFDDPDDATPDERS